MHQNHVDYLARLNFVRNLLRERYNLKVVCCYAVLSIFHINPVTEPRDHPDRIRPGVSLHLQQLRLQSCPTCANYT